MTTQTRDAPDSDGFYSAPTILGGWRVYYGESDWPSRSYWIIPERTDEIWVPEPDSLGG